MQDLAHPYLVAYQLGAAPGEITHSNYPFRLEGLDGLAQMFIARRKKLFLLAQRQFVRRAIASGGFHKSQRAIVEHQVLTKEFLGRTEPCGEESPEPLSAYLRALTIQSGNGPLRMLLRRGDDLYLDLEPVTHRFHLSKRHPCLDHAKRSRVHAQKNHALGSAGEAPQVSLVTGPRILQRVVNV